MPLSCLRFLFLSALLYLSTRVSAQTYNDTEFAPASFWEAHADKPAIIITANSSRFSGRSKSVAQCLCSPSARGHPPLNDPDISNFTELLTELSTLPLDSLRIPTFHLKLNRLSATFIARYGAEGYTNLDAKLRSILPMTHCFYDVPSGRNVRIFKRIPGGRSLISMRGCDKNDSTASPAAARASFVPSPGPSRPFQLDLTDAALDVDEVVEQQSLVPVPSAASPLPSPSSATASGPPAVPISSPTPSPQTRLNEGCVAVEHLKGYAMQHRSHLRRAVLCYRGFCATPNHVIIVDGAWTSMKRICAAEWTCTNDVRLVNNLKISELTRLRFDARIVITPYDDRFPVSLPWVVQIAEDVLVIVLLSLKIAGFIVFAMAAYFSLAAEKRISQGCEKGTGHVRKRWGLCEAEIKEWISTQVTKALMVPQ